MVRIEPGIKEEGAYFRGPGMMVVGNDRGQLLAASYADTPDGDPLAEKYPGYQRVALRKVGLAAAIVRSELLHDVIWTADVYDRVEERLAEEGISSSGGPGHHLGYAAREMEDGTFITVGATGMLPSQETDWRVRSRTASRLEADRTAGLFEWETDAFAGFHDMVAAEHVALDLTVQGGLPEWMHPFDLLPAQFPNINLH
jgi:hypothetical protein